MEAAAPLVTAELRQTLFPDASQLYFDLQTIHQILVIWGLQLRKVSQEKMGEGGTSQNSERKRESERHSQIVNRRGGINQNDERKQESERHSRVLTNCRAQIER